MTETPRFDRFPNVLEEARSMVRARVAAALSGLLPDGAKVPEYVLEQPKDPAHGDFAVNLAMLLAKPLRRAPRTIAEELAGRIELIPPLERVEVAGPGFLNFFLSPRWLDGVIPAVLAAGERYGHSRPPAGEVPPPVLIEFVSANPTGPLNVVNSRAAAFGDALARILEASGQPVKREYYVNDAGNQFRKLALAMETRWRQLHGEAVELPEGAYPGEYLKDLAAEVKAAGGVPGGDGGGVRPLPEDPEERAEMLARYAVERLVAEQRATLERFGVTFDRWYRESEVRAAGGPAAVVEALKQRGFTYESEGAVWLRTTAFGDDKDRVLVRSSGEYTYFVPDIAYHLDKLERGFGRLIDIWGQDHHGYIPRMKAALQALGRPAETLEVLLTQMVRLVRGGKTVKMSKRGGEFVTMDEFLDEAGVDAARFTFLTRTIDSHMDFDLDLAVAQSNENPVYYVQYAHARIASILRQGAGQGEVPPSPEEAAGIPFTELLADESERALLLHVAALPDEVRRAAELREPHRLTVYARELATLFHAFYGRCRVLGGDSELTRARLALAAAVRQTLANTLGLLGVSAPERM